MMALRASGESAWPPRCFTIMSTVPWLMAVPFTVATTGPLAAAAAGVASVLPPPQALRVSSDTALARKIPCVSLLMGLSLGRG